MLVAPEIPAAGASAAQLAGEGVNLGWRQRAKGASALQEKLQFAAAIRPAGGVEALLPRALPFFAPKRAPPKLDGVGERGTGAQHGKIERAAFAVRDAAFGAAQQLAGIPDKERNRKVGIGNNEADAEAESAQTFLQTGGTGGGKGFVFGEVLIEGFFEGFDKQRGQGERRGGGQDEHEVIAAAQGADRPWWVFGFFVEPGEQGVFGRSEGVVDGQAQSAVASGAIEPVEEGAGVGAVGVEQGHLVGFFVFDELFERKRFFAAGTLAAGSGAAAQAGGADGVAFVRAGAAGSFATGVAAVAELVGGKNGRQGKGTTGTAQAGGQGGAGGGVAACGFRRRGGLVADGQESKGGGKFRAIAAEVAGPDGQAGGDGFEVVVGVVGKAPGEGGGKVVGVAGGGEKKAGSGAGINEAGTSQGGGVFEAEVINKDAAATKVDGAAGFEKVGLDGRGFKGQQGQGRQRAEVGKKLGMAGCIASGMGMADPGIELAGSARIKVRVGHEGAVPGFFEKALTEGLAELLADVGEGSRGT